MSSWPVPCSAGGDWEGSVIRAKVADEFDATTARTWLAYVRTALWPYFRPQVIGTENLPRGRGLVVGLHSGVIPYDAACALVAIQEATGRIARAVGDRFFRGLGAEPFLARQGAFVGDPAKAEMLLRRGNLILDFPGGARDMERSYLRQRYRVMPHAGWAAGRGGFVKLALRCRSPIIPMAIVGAEEAHVMLASLPPLARLLRVPLFPLLLFPLPLPTRFYIRFGEAIDLPGGPSAARDQARVDRLTASVRRTLQALIDDTLRRRQGLVFSTYRGETAAGPRSAAPPSASRRRHREGQR